MIRLLIKAGHPDWRHDGHTDAPCNYGEHPATRRLQLADGRKVYACLAHHAQIEAGLDPPVFARARLPLPTIPPPIPPKPKDPLMSPTKPAQRTVDVPHVPPAELRKLRRLKEFGPATYSELMPLWELGSVKSARASGGRLRRAGLLEWQDDERLRVSALGERALERAPAAAPSVNTEPVRPAKKPELVEQHVPTTSLVLNAVIETVRPIVVRLGDMVVELRSVAEVAELRKALGA